MVSVADTASGVAAVEEDGIDCVDFNSHCIVVIHTLALPSYKIDICRQQVQLQNYRKAILPTSHILLSLGIIHF